MSLGKFVESRRGDRRNPEGNPADLDGIEQKPLFRPSGTMCMNCLHVDRDCSYLDFSSMQVIARDTKVTQVVKCSEYVKAKGEV